MYSSQNSLIAVGGAYPHGYGNRNVSGAPGTIGFLPGVIPGLDLLGSLFGGGNGVSEPDPHASAPAKAGIRVQTAISTTPTTFTPTAAPAGKMSEMEFAVAKQVAQRELNGMLQQLQQQWPVAPGISMYRHNSSGGSGSNYSTTLPQGSHPILHHSKNPRDWMLNEMSRMVVKPGTKAIVWQNLNFSGPTMELGPNDHNLAAYGWNDKNAPKSGVIVPNVDFDGIIHAVAQKIVNLSSPANGCIIDASSFQGGQLNHPALAALGVFIDRVVALTQGSPLAQKYQTMKATLPGQIAAGVLANMQACAAQRGTTAPTTVTPQPGIAPPALPTLGPYWFGVGGKADGPHMGPAIRANIANGTVTRQTYAWKQGMVGWLAAGEVPELKPLFGAAPPAFPTAPAGCATRMWKGVCLPAQLTGCEEQGGFLQGKVNTSTGRIRRNTVRCTMPQSSRVTMRAGVAGQRVYGVAGRKRRRRVGGPVQATSPIFSQRPLSVIEADWQARQGGGVYPGMAPGMAPPMPPMECPPCDYPPPVWPLLTADSDPDQALIDIRDQFGQFRKDARTFRRTFTKHMKGELGKPFVNQMGVAVKNLTGAAGDVRKLARDFLSGDWSPPEAGGGAALLKALGVSGPSVVYGPNTMTGNRYVC